MGVSSIPPPSGRIPQDYAPDAGPKFLLQTGLILGWIVRKIWSRTSNGIAGPPRLYPSVSGATSAAQNFRERMDAIPAPSASSIALISGDETKAEDPRSIPLPPSPELLPVVDVEERNQTSNSESFMNPQGALLSPPTHEKLRLESLALERVFLDILVLGSTIDWSYLTSLTILNCNFHEQLFKSLKREFHPWPKGAAVDSRPTNRKARKCAKPIYQLRIKRIHTDSVSPALMSFLRATLAPNSLEWLFLQQTVAYESLINIGDIYRDPLRHHQKSLTKVLIDSADWSTGRGHRASRWRKWMLDRDTLAFITSGKMCSLRELSIAMDYADWVSLSHAV